MKKWNKIFFLSYSICPKILLMESITKSFTYRKREVITLMEKDVYKNYHILVL